MVARDRANGGVLMQHAPLDEVRAPNWEALTGDDPAQGRPRDLHADRPGADADDGGVVTGGTGTAARFPASASPVRRHREIGMPRTVLAWFIAFAPADSQKSRRGGDRDAAGFGGQVAAPIAKALMEAILARKSNT